jgi:2-methylcitrate dehydratase PrpD
MKDSSGPVKTAYTSTLVDFACNTGYGDIPADTIHQTKRVILDAIGCALAGTTTGMGQAVIRTIRGLSGDKGESTIVASDFKSSCGWAAFGNAQIGTAMDVDECLVNFCHPASAILFAGLAVAERAGGSGKDLIAAMALGYDIAGRIGVSIPRETRVDGNPPNLSTVSVRNTDFAWHVFGSATAAAKMLKLDGIRLANAFGVAGVNAPVAATVAMKGYSGSLPMAKYNCAGVNSMNGVTAALLAEQGFTGGQEILDGDYGFYRLAGVERRYPEVLTEDLGEFWWINETSFKLYPACRIVHPAVDAIYYIMSKNNLKPEDIAAVGFGVNPRVAGHFDLLSIEESLDPVSLQFCFPLCLGLAACGIEPRDWQEDESLHNPQAIAFARKVKLFPKDEAMQVVYNEVGNEPKPVKRIPTYMIVTTTDGRTIEEYREFARGDPWDPATRLTDEELSDKFRSYAGKVLNDGQIDKIIDTVYGLEKVENVRTLTDPLRP